MVYSVAPLTGDFSSPTERMPRSPPITADHPLFKTSSCKFFRAGICAKGDNCNHAHSDSDRVFEYDRSVTKLCGLVSAGLDCPDPFCKFAHSTDEIRQFNRLYKTQVCRFWKRGHCTHGSPCRFAHSFEEARNNLESNNGGTPYIPFKGDPSCYGVVSPSKQWGNQQNSNKGKKHTVLTMRFSNKI